MLVHGVKKPSGWDEFLGQRYALVKNYYDKHVYYWALLCCQPSLDVREKYMFVEGSKIEM